MAFSQDVQKIWNMRDRSVSYQERTLVMGILNVTPDSFSDGGIFYTPEEALRGALILEEDGADILDIGAESTRPGSERISADEELSRLIPALKIISERIRIPISVDTYKSKTAYEALNYGASIINDVWGLQKDPQMAEVVAEKKAGVVIMANYTDPAIFERKSDIISDCLRFFESLEILRSVPLMQEKGFPILIGHSRKRFIGETLQGVPADQRDAATVAVSLYCSRNQAACVRVHNVFDTVTAMKMQAAL